MTNGHGDHWGAIDGDAKASVAELFPAVVQKGKLDGQSFFDCPQDSGGTIREKVFGLMLGHLPLRFMALVITNSAAKTNEVASGYPFCAEGVSNMVKVLSIKPWEGNIEAVIEVETKGGASLCFFDPHFYKTKDMWRVGQDYEISLAALAMRLQKPLQNELQITAGPLLELDRQRALENDPNADVSKITSVTVSLRNCCYCVPNEDYPDEAEYRGVAEEVGYFETEGRGFFRIKTTLIKADDNPVSAYVYASESVLKGYRPQVSDSLEGWLWMQGWLARPIEKQES